MSRRARQVQICVRPADAADVPQVADYLFAAPDKRFGIQFKRASLENNLLAAISAPRRCPVALTMAEDGTAVRGLAVSSRHHDDCRNCPVDSLVDFEYEDEETGGAIIAWLKRRSKALQLQIDIPSDKLMLASSRGFEAPDPEHRVLRRPLVGGELSDLKQRARRRPGGCGDAVPIDRGDRVFMVHRGEPRDTAALIRMTRRLEQEVGLKEANKCRLLSGIRSSLHNGNPQRGAFVVLVEDDEPIGSMKIINQPDPLWGVSVGYCRRVFIAKQYRGSELSLFKEFIEGAVALCCDDRTSELRTFCTWGISSAIDRATSAFAKAGFKTDDSKVLVEWRRSDAA